MTKRIVIRERFEFTEAETKQAMILPEINRQFIMTQICDLALEKENLSFDTANHLQFIQREAELKGQIGILQFLLDCHENTITELEANSRASASQSQS